MSLCLGHVLPEEWSDSEDQVDVYNLIERYVVTISSLIDKPHGMYSHNQLSNRQATWYSVTISSLIDKPHGM